MLVTTNDLFGRILQFIERHNLIPPGSALVIGLSGGPDSVFLLYVLVYLRSLYDLSLIAAHLDHEWRAHSHEDMLFCKKLAEEFSVPFVHARASELQADRAYNGSQEELGRLLRRMFLSRVAQEYCADRIALAHHRDDQYETFFIRLLRGAGITGLAGMQSYQDGYIRPLLEVSKAEILDHLAQHNLAYRIDPTNTSTLYLRNRIRGLVIPALRACDPRFDTTFARTLENLQEARDFIERLAHTTLEQISTYKDEKRWIDLDRFFELDPFIQKQLLLVWFCAESVSFIPSQAFFHEVLRFLRSSQSVEHKLYPTWSLIKLKRHAAVKIINAEISTNCLE